MTTPTSVHPSTTRTAPGQRLGPRWLAATGVGFVVVALLLLDALSASTWATAVVVAVVVLAALPAVREWARPSPQVHIDRWDLAVITGLYVGVVALFRLAFVGFTQANVLGLFLAFAGGLLLGSAGPIVYTTWVRGRPLSTLGLGLHHRRPQPSRSCSRACSSRSRSGAISFPPLSTGCRCS